MLNFLPVKKSVDSVMSAFNTTIADLEALRARELEAASRLDDEATMLSAQANSSRREAGRALSITAKLKELVGA